MLQRTRDILLWLWRQDWIEGCKTALIWTCGVIEFSLLLGIIFSGIWLYAIAKGVT